MRPTGPTIAVAILGGVGLVGEVLDVEPFGIVFGICAATLLLAYGLAVAHIERVTIEPPLAAMSFATVPRALPIQVGCRPGIFAARDLLLGIEDGRKGDPPISGHVARVAPGNSAPTSVTPRFRDRGRRTEAVMHVRSSYPFGLFEVRRKVTVPFDHLVLPRMGRLGPLERRLAHIRGSMDDAPRGALGTGEFFGLREWREGESLRHVHWKLSGRRGRFLVRELMSEDRPAMRLVLSCWVYDSLRSGRQPSFERAVSLTATLVEHYLRRGHKLELMLAGSTPRILSLRRGRGALITLLSELAEVRHESGEPTDAFIGVPNDGRFVNLFVVAGGRVKSENVEGRPSGAWVLDVDDESGLEVFEGMRDIRATRVTERDLLGEVAP